MLSDDHPHGPETAQDPVEPPVVVVVVIVIVGPVGRHQGAAVGHLNNVQFFCTLTYSIYASLRSQSEAQFMVPDWGYKVDCGIGLSYRPVGLHTL